MKTNQARIKAIVLILTSCLGLTMVGCNSIKKYQAFSKAGIEYNKALDELLKCTADVTIDGTSLTLLENDNIGFSSRESYIQNTEKNEQTLELVNLLRDQVSLLQGYFIALNNLATLNETLPGEAGSEITNISNGLTAIVGKFQENPQFPNAEFNTGVGEIVELLVSSKLKKVIRDELEDRKKLLQTQFLIHEIMVNTLTDFNLNDLQKLRSAREGRLVVEPLLQEASITDGSQWIETRGEIFNIWKLMYDLKSVSSMPNDFSLAFEEIVTGDASLTRANSLESKFSRASTIYQGLCDYASYKQAVFQSPKKNKLVKQFGLRSIKPEI